MIIQIELKKPFYLFSICLLLIANFCSGNFLRKDQVIRSRTIEKLPMGFTGNFVNVNGARIYYRSGGKGPALLLLHGFPEDGSAFKKIMSLTARKFTVIVPDLRGIGKSAATGGYDAQNIAKDFYEILKLKQIQHVYVVGLDMAGNVVYAFARLYPKMTKGIILAEAPLAGLDPWKDISAAVWHIPFQESSLVPELLMQGKQASYFRSEFFSFSEKPVSFINENDLLHYANAYKSSAQLNAGLGLYRAVKTNSNFNLNRREKLDVPVQLINAEKSLGPFTARSVISLRQHGATNVSFKIIKNATHYLADEDPNQLYTLIHKFFENK